MRLEASEGSKAVRLVHVVPCKRIEYEWADDGSTEWHREEQRLSADPKASIFVESVAQAGDPPADFPVATIPEFAQLCRIDLTD